MFGWEFARDFPRGSDALQGLGRRHGRCLSTAPAFVPWDARCGGDGVLELWGARQKTWNKLGCWWVRLNLETSSQIFALGSCLMVEGRKRLVILRCLCFCFCRWEGSVCRHLWIIHTGCKVKWYPDILLVVQHLSEDPISTFRATAWKPQYI